MKKKMKKPIVLHRRGIIPVPTTGASVVAFFENGVLVAAREILPATTNLLQAQLVLALWLVLAKVKLEHRQVGPFVAKLLKSCPSLPSRSELDLWIRMLLGALYDYKYIPTSDLKFYRQNCAALHRVTREQVEEIANDFLTLRAMQHEFAPAKPTDQKSPDERILDLLTKLRVQLEESPDAVSEAIQTEFQNIQSLLDNSRPSRPVKRVPSTRKPGKAARKTKGRKH